MNLKEAIELSRRQGGANIRDPKTTDSDYREWLGPGSVVYSADAVLSETWEVEELAVKISKSQVIAAIADVREWFDLYPPQPKTLAVGQATPTWRDFAEKVANRLGLEPL